MIKLVVLLLLPILAYAQDVAVNYTALSSPRRSFSCIQADNKLYFAGGYENNDFAASSRVDVYNMDTQLWEEPLKLPSQPRAFITPILIEPNIYFVGGVNFNNSLHFFSTENQLFKEAPQNNEPTVLRPIQVSVHESNVTIVGTNSVDIFNMEDEQWSSSEELTNIMARLFGSVVFSAENYVFVLGGMNVSTRQLVDSAWVYDVTTSTIKSFSNVISTPFNHAESRTFEFVSAFNTTAVWFTDRCYFYRSENDDWLEVNISNVLTVVPTEKNAFVFTSDGFETIKWDSGLVDRYWTETLVQHAIGIDGQAVYFKQTTSTTMAMVVYSNYQWNEVTLPIADFGFDIVVQQLAWPGTGYVFADKLQRLFVYDSTNQSITAHNDFTSTQILSLMMFSDTHFALTTTSDDGTNVHVVEFQTMIYATYTTPSRQPTVCHYAICFDFSAHKVVFPTSPENEMNIPFGAPVKWATSDTSLVMMQTSDSISPVGTMNRIQHIDVYNYKIGAWQESSLESPSEPMYEHTVVTAQEDSLVIVTQSGIDTYNTTTGDWSVVYPSNPFPFENRGVTQRAVFDYNGFIYVSTSVVALVEFSEDWTRSFTDVADYSFWPKQFILNGQEVIVSTEFNGRSLTFFVYDFANEYWQSFLMPSEREDVTAALSGQFLMTLSTDPQSFDYCYLPKRTWGTAPLNNYYSPSAVTTITYNATNIIVLAGGTDRELGFFSESVLLLNIDSLEIPIEPVAEPEQKEIIAPSTTDPVPALSSDMLAVAIVVPIVVVLVAVALVVFFLVRRRNKRKKRVTTVGLQGRFGQWYTPFEEIKFGSQLGQGANGQVFKGTWKGATVALKASMTQANESVIRELELMIKLRPHPNVVQLLGFSIHPETDSVILVLEFCDGGSLSDVLFDESHTVTLPQKVQWLVGVSQGISHLHANHIVHRDVAARNVLLHKNEAKITDFGMSRLVSDNQRGTTKSELGPIRWMSPEALKSKEYSDKSDAWSFGILMYEVVAQQEPHVNADPIEIGRMIRDQGVTPPIPASCPNQLASLMQSCWHVSPALRPDFETITQQLENVTF